MRSLREYKTLLSLSHAKGAKDAEFNANYAIAEVVAGYARQRAQRQIVDEDGKLSHTKHQSADTCHHWGACGLF